MIGRKRSPTTQPSEAVMHFGQVLELSSTANAFNAGIEPERQKHARARRRLARTGDLRRRRFIQLRQVYVLHIGPDGAGRMIRTDRGADLDMLEHDSFPRVCRVCGHSLRPDWYFLPRHILTRSIYLFHRRDSSLIDLKSSAFDKRSVALLTFLTVNYFGVPRAYFAPAISTHVAAGPCSIETRDEHFALGSASRPSALSDGRRKRITSTRCLSMRLCKCATKAEKKTRNHALGGGPAILGLKDVRRTARSGKTCARTSKRAWSAGTTIAIHT